MIVFEGTGHSTQAQFRP